ncbi:protein of unknown function [Cupriavidus taiwanensis]|uniref:Uncharacterized protein n=1 Tax=Cupriavidus taiwanensis TaxID=164546 RepID=A0A9Q7XQ19_9BURK|nr:protein of unknown function [Cupriavidus taiwanensis]
MAAKFFPAYATLRRTLSVTDFWDLRKVSELLRRIPQQKMSIESRVIGIRLAYSRQCQWRGLGIESHPHQRNVWPLHRQQGASRPDTLINLIAVVLRPAALPRPPPPAPSGQGARFRSPPCIPHRPTLH